ncbi:MAG: cupin domain-containing protein [Pseudomonas neustonica]
MVPLIKRLEPGAEYYFVEGCFITELSNSEQDPAVSVARARVPVGGTTRWHALKEVVERYLIEAGQGEVELGELPPQKVAPGDMVLIPAGCAQRIRNTGEEQLLFLAICSPRFQPDCYQDLEAEVG